MRNPFSKTRLAEFRVRNSIEKEPIPIYDIGAIGISGLLNERVVPVLIADLTLRPDIAELIRIHENHGFGDINMLWGDPEKSGFIRLIISFIRPIECLAMFDFEISQFGAAVDAIFRNRALYLQAGAPTTKISDNPAAPKIFCEIPSVGVESQWERLYEKSMFKEYRRQGLSRAKAKQAARHFISVTRSFDRSLTKSLSNKR